MHITRNDNDSTAFVFYRYQPSMAAAIIFIILFGVATSLHFAQLLRSRTWFMIPFLIGGMFETIGYVGRVLSASQSPGPYRLGPYIIQSVLLLVAPALFAASIYMELGRIVRMCDADNLLFIRRTWLTKIFVCGDVLSFLMQSSGAELLASGSASSTKTGNDIVVAGLFLQILFFGLFVAAAGLFHGRLSKAPTAKSFEFPVKKHMIGLYIVSILILIRSIVRVVEFIQGNAGFIMAHEAFMYVFDGLVMFIAVATMNANHPGEVARIVRGGKKEAKGGMRMKTVGVQAVRMQCEQER